MDTGNGDKTITQHSIYLQSWGVNLTVVIYDGRQWFLVRQICTLLGIRTDNQVDVLRERELLAGMVLQLPVMTSKGLRDSWCLDIQAVGAWMIMISDRRVNKEVKPNLLKLQRDIMQAARRVMFGEVSTYATTQEVDDIRRFAWYLEARIDGQERRLNMQVQMPESDDE